MKLLKYVAVFFSALLSGLDSVFVGADNQKQSDESAETQSFLESWQQFARDLEAIGPEMLKRLPPRLRHDPQSQQEAGRLLLSALASRTLEALAGDRNHPVFVPWMNSSITVAQPNPDTLYKKALIAPGGSYRLRGSVGSLMMTTLAQVDGLPEEGDHPAAPGMGILVWNRFDTLTVDENGFYDVILSPKHPENYTGDWWPLKPEATALLVRQVAYDWRTERDPTISIERIDSPARRERVPAEVLDRRLRGLAEETRYMGLWLIDHVEVLRSEQAINEMEEMRVGGKKVSDIGGVPGQFYYEGPYELEAGEALILEAKVPPECVYWSLLLTNDLFETTDWHNNHSSLNGTQVTVDRDGVFRAVISDVDPGVANWLDTAGYRSGVIQGRWTGCLGDPVLPTLKKIRLEALYDVLPADTVRVSEEQREEILRDRRAYLQWRRLW